MASQSVLMWICKLAGVSLNSGCTRIIYSWVHFDNSRSYLASGSSWASSVDVQWRCVCARAQHLLCLHVVAMTPGTLLLLLVSHNFCLLPLLQTKSQCNTDQTIIIFYTLPLIKSMNMEQQHQLQLASVPLCSVCVLILLYRRAEKLSGVY